MLLKHLLEIPDLQLLVAALPEDPENPRFSESSFPYLNWRSRGSLTPFVQSIYETPNQSTLIPLRLVENEMKILPTLLYRVPKKGNFIKNLAETINKLNLDKIGLFKGDYSSAEWKELLDGLSGKLNIQVAE